MLCVQSIFQEKRNILSFTKKSFVFVVILTFCKTWVSSPWIKIISQKGNPPPFSKLSVVKFILQNSEKKLIFFVTLMKNNIAVSNGVTVSLTNPENIASMLNLNSNASLQIGERSGLPSHGSWPNEVFIPKRAV